MDQVKILGIAYGYNQLEMGDSVRNLQGTGHRLDAEESKILKKMVRDLDPFTRFLDKFGLQLAAAVALDWAVTLALGFSLGASRDSLVTMLWTVAEGLGAAVSWNWKLVISYYLELIWAVNHGLWALVAWVASWPLVLTLAVALGLSVFLMRAFPGVTVGMTIFPRETIGWLCGVFWSALIKTVSVAFCIVSVPLALFVVVDSGLGSMVVSVVGLVPSLPWFMLAIHLAWKVAFVMYIRETYYKKLKPVFE